MRISDILTDGIKNKLNHAGRKKYKYRAIMQNIVGMTFFDFKLIRIRRYFYKAFFDVGEGLVVGHNVKLQRRHTNAHNEGCDIKIGDNVLLASDSRIDYSGGIILKNNVKISCGVLILTHTHMTDHAAYINRIQPIRFSQLIIDEKAWLGERAIILPGVSRIGQGAVIGSGAVVGRDVPDYAIVSGNPGKIIGYSNK
ncbi:acyltransferase [Butyrivibrio sp. XPD2006]|uniref:acyltransferase n=1 Tax=Butyrivibrio sp. XPD2006 TaxID=1280668 RepID=UPI000416AE99|nr:acyltransferase [Butyrivibrio sp. XPD2006]